MQLSESILLFITAVITAISAFFCLIALATPRWSLAFGLFCHYCPTPPGGLSIVAFILLLAAVVILLLFALRILPKSLRVTSLLVLFLATIFTMSAYASYVDSGTGYSFKLMIFSHFLCYIASLLAAFWLGGSYGTSVVTPTNP
jgi:hypothetical protein